MTHNDDDDAPRWLWLAVAAGRTATVAHQPVAHPLGFSESFLRMVKDRR